MNITGRPVTQKAGKAKRDPAHMARVAQLPCIICGRHGVQVHHVTHDRHSQRRAADTETIPLCLGCHDELHANKTAWRQRYGADHSYLPAVAEALARQERSKI